MKQKIEFKQRYLNRHILFSIPHPSSYILRGGFTLIEILVSLAILSVVLTAIYSTFFLSHRAIEGMDESMVQLQESRSALDILKRELDSALYDVKDEKTLFKILDRDIYGRQAVELSFATFSPVRPGLSRITYSVEDKDGILHLLKKVESPYGKTDVTGEPIIEGIEGFAVEAKYGDQWVRTWDTDVNKGIPHEIRITLSLVIKGRKTEISDIAKPKIGRQV